MPRCLVPNCPNKYKLGNKQPRRKSFFQVPHGRKDAKKWELAKKWLDFCHIDITKFLFTQHKAICEDHFEPELIEKINQKVFPHGFHGQIPKRLVRGSLPTLNGPVSQKEDSREGVCQPEQPPRESSVICEKIRYQPKSAPRKQVADLARWPPDTLIKAEDLNSILTCGLCKSYFYHATTITECLHTFCKGCLVKHFYTSLHCPTCKILVHPSDPFACIKIDHTMQDLVEKIFPERYKDESISEINFYKSRGLTPPQPEDDEHSAKAQVTEPPPVKMVSVMLDYIGTSPHLPPHYPLVKNFLRIPDNVTIQHIQKFLKNKMRLPLSCQAAMFVNTSMLQGSLTVRKVERIFGHQAMRDLKDLIVLQFGIIPKGDYFQEGLLINTKDV